ncbi:hypothetical protein FF38_05480 [Lucilia cuprina]|uniref:Uncharacterized protein n=1 Tax=Lucilia cuprina TaxID=7375 RepID=A0A0L0CDF3_LUCCU|nr:hypothetical protein FF38_05480 [Lucilia cuprina]
MTGCCEEEKQSLLQDTNEDDTYPDSYSDFLGLRYTLHLVTSFIITSIKKIVNDLRNIDYQYMQAPQTHNNFFTTIDNLASDTVNGLTHATNFAVDGLTHATHFAVNTTASNVNKYRSLVSWYNFKGYATYKTMSGLEWVMYCLSYLPSVDVGYSTACLAFNINSGGSDYIIMLVYTTFLTAISFASIYAAVCRAYCNPVKCLFFTLIPDFNYNYVFFLQHYINLHCISRSIYVYRMWSECKKWSGCLIGVSIINLTAHIVLHLFTMDRTPNIDNNFTFLASIGLNDPLLEEMYKKEKGIASEDQLPQHFDHSS